MTAKTSKMCHIIIGFIAKSPNIRTASDIWTALTTFKHARRMLSLNRIQQRHGFDFHAVIVDAI